MSHAQYFMHLGCDNRPFEYAADLTQKSINALFQQATQPYSGLAPEALKAQLEAVDLSKTEPLIDVVSMVNHLVAKNSILVQHAHTLAH